MIAPSGGSSAGQRPGPDTDQEPPAAGAGPATRRHPAGDRAAGVHPVGDDPAGDDPAGDHPAGVHPDGHPHAHLHPHLQLREQVERLEHRLKPLIEAAEHVGAATAHLAAHQAGRLVPAWRRATAGELRWPVSAVVAAMIAMQVGVPQRLSLAGRWVVPGVEGVLLAILVVSDPARMTRRSPVLRGLSLVLIATASLGNAYSAAGLVVGLVRGTEGSDPAVLLATGGDIWLTNIIVFGLWYWELDRGGPACRAQAVDIRPSFLFPEMTVPHLAGLHWAPQIFDYVYLAYTNATAFSPTDTMPMSRWSKLTMMMQSIVSLATGMLVIARAINLLR